MILESPDEIRRQGVTVYDYRTPEERGLVALAQPDRIAHAISILATATDAEIATLIAAENLGRRGFGFEIKKDFYAEASAWIAHNKAVRTEIKANGYSKTLAEKQNPNQAFLFA